MQRVRTALIGCGKVGGIHAAALATLPEAELVAVCDASAERGHGIRRHATDDVVAVGVNATVAVGLRLLLTQRVDRVGLLLRTAGIAGRGVGILGGGDEVVCLLEG